MLSASSWRVTIDEIMMMSAFIRPTRIAGLF